MNYNVEVLKKMIRVYDSNIKMFSKYNNVERQLALMVKERRDIAALIENDGVLDSYMNRPDSMMYSANTPGTDTSWWTYGT